MIAVTLFFLSVPEAAVIVVMWGFFASSFLFVLWEFRETRELEQAVETTLPWERQPKTPEMAFLTCKRSCEALLSVKNSASHV